MPWPLVSIVPKYIEIELNKSLSLVPIASKYLKMPFHIVEKNCAMATEFIVAVAA